MNHFERDCLFCAGTGGRAVWAGDPPEMKDSRKCRACSGTGVIIPQPRVNLVGGGMIYPTIVISDS